MLLLENVRLLKLQNSVLSDTFSKWQHCFGPHWVCAWSNYDNSVWNLCVGRVWCKLSMCPCKLARLLPSQIEDIFVFRMVFLKIH